jgi:Peptidase A4 family
VNSWAGYSLTAQDVTGVRAEWIEPSVSGVARSAEYLWVGIGPADGASVVQTGTYVIFPGGRYEERGAWYERYPLDTGGITENLAENPGDTITTTLTLLPGPGWRWHMTVRDVTTGAAWSKAVSFKTAGNADFIVEDPAVNMSGTLAPFATWGQVLFTHVAVRVGQHWRPTGEIGGLRIDMIQRGRTVATAGPLLDAGTSFVATQNP